MKILFGASVYRHLTSFHLPYMEMFKSRGHEVYAMGTGIEDRKILQQLGIKCIDIPFSRTPFSKNTIKAYIALKQIFKEEKFDLVHVHTPVASLLTRVAFRNQKSGKIIYTAHGFHFFDGASKINWLIYYTAEKIAAKWTDHLITINKEDYINGQRLIEKDKISFVHGVGVESLRPCLTSVEKEELKQQMAIKKESIVITYLAELNGNKNHKFLLRNWAAIKNSNPNYELLIVGSGILEAELKKYVVDNKLNDIHFLGYRRDVPKILEITDIMSLLSFREGLPKSIMEAMSFGIPCVVSNTRGLRDLIKSEENGYVVNHSDNQGLIQAFNQLYNRELRSKMKESALFKIQLYTLDNVLQEYEEIYNKILK